MNSEKTSSHDKKRSSVWEGDNHMAVLREHFFKEDDFTLPIVEAELFGVDGVASSNNRNSEAMLRALRKEPDLSDDS